MKKITKRLIILFGFLLVLITFNQKVEATSISFSNSNPKVGEAVTVTVSVPNVHTAQVYANVTGPGISTTINVVGGDLAGNKSTISNSATVTPTATGTISVSINSNSNAVADGNYVSYETLNASATVNVSEASSGGSGDSGSSDSGNSGGTTVSAPTLSNLGIRPHDFSGFKSGTTSYSVTVPNDCTSVTIYANSNNGSITGTGTVTLKEGTNRYTVTVSNSAGSKDYTLSIIRQTQDSEIIPNTIEDEGEDEETENTSEGIGLTGLRITGYNFEEEFQTETYEYTVKIPEGLTEAELEDIKNSITAITNTDEAYVEIETTLNEDGSAVITLRVKDDEREYSTYTINFVIDESVEETVAVAGTTTSNNSSGGGISLENMTTKIYILLGCLGVAILFAIFFAANAYSKSKRLEKYEPKEKDEYEDENNLISSIYAETQGKPLTSSLNYKDLTNDINSEEKEDKVGSKISEMLKDDSNIPEYSVASEESEIIDDKPNTFGRIRDTKDKLNDLNSYRKFRRGFSSGGKH